MYNLSTVRALTIASHRGRLLLAVFAIAAAALLLFAGPGILPLFVMLGLLYGGFRVATGPLPAFISRLRLSIRWKILAGICFMGGLLLLVTVVNVQAMDYMHSELHDIENLGAADPARVLPAVVDLESTQHGPFFSLMPVVSLMAGFLALGIGVALAISVIEPIHRMGLAMNRIASGDLSQRVDVSNRDELGELADSINSTAQELARLQEAKLADERAHALRERISQVTLAQEEERRRISRELHDGLGPSLAAIVNRLRACQETVDKDPAEARVELEEIRQSLRGHIQDIRHLIYDLRPLAVDQLGLRGALQQLLDRFVSDTGIETLSDLIYDENLDPLTEVTVFRVVQECLSNVQKHADATRVEVRIRRAKTDLEVAVRDNGRGFAPLRGSGQTTNEGVGLVSMRERAELVGGRLSVTSSPGKGCLVSILIPHKEQWIGTDTDSAG